MLNHMSNMATVAMLNRMSNMATVAALDGTSNRLEAQMHGDELFLKLVLHLRAYCDAALLWTLLRQRGDLMEVRGSIQTLSHDWLAQSVTPRQTRLAIQRLERMNLIDTRVHRKTATIITVHRSAVLDLLQQPLDARLPGIDRVQFPFLRAVDGRPSLPDEPEVQCTAVDRPVQAPQLARASQPTSQQESS
jgi:hypothetical protein